MIWTQDRGRFSVLYRPFGDAACAARSLCELHLRLAKSRPAGGCSLAQRLRALVISQLALTASPLGEAFWGREMVSLPALFGSPGDDRVSGGTG